MNEAEKVTEILLSHIPKEQRCAKCKGFKYIQRKVHGFGGEYYDMFSCSECNGTGEKREQKNE